MYRNHLGILSNENEYFSTQPIFSIDTVRREDGRRKEERQTNKTGDHQSCSICCCCCCCVGEDTVSRVCVSIMQTSHRIPAHRHQIKKQHNGPIANGSNNAIMTKFTRQLALVGIVDDIMIRLNRTHSLTHCCA